MLENCGSQLVPFSLFLMLEFAVFYDFTGKRQKPQEKPSECGTSIISM